MHDLSGFQRDLLYVIYRLDRPSGQEVKDDLETYYDDPINRGRLYTNLDTLVEKGYVRKGQRTRRSNYYEISEMGIQALTERQEWERRYFEEA